MVPLVKKSVQMVIPLVPAILQMLLTNGTIGRTRNTRTVKRQKLKVVDKFTYPGRTLSRAVHIDDDVTARIVKASVTFGRTKLKVYNAVVLTTLLYDLYPRHVKRLNHFHLNCLRKLLKSSSKTRFRTHRSPEEDRNACV